MEIVIHIQIVLIQRANYECAAKGIRLGFALERVSV